VIPFFLLDKGMQETIRRERKREVEQRLGRCVDWDPWMPFDKELNLKASSWNPRILFPEVTPSPAGTQGRKLWKNGKEYYAESPRGTWRYCHMTLGRGAKTTIGLGSKRGTVLYDGDVIVPAVFRRPYAGSDSWNAVSQFPAMSHTPMEIFTLRPGTRRAKGDVIVAGLGLGHQLIDVSNRKKVKRLRLIEINQELIDWIYPRIQPHLGMEVEVIVADAYKVLPDMTADVVLLDTFTGYGGNDTKRNEVMRTGNFGFVWAWGTQYLEGSDSLW
jgi:hypothetical protein